MTPQLTVIIPTYNRPQLLKLAVDSALNQTFQNLEVLVVDDASDEPVNLPEEPRLRVIRLERSRGGAGARNVGTEAAQGRWITYLDDDDSLLPHMVERSLAAIAHSSLPAPVGVLSGLEKVSQTGDILDTRLPPDHCPKGGDFFLEPLQSGRSYLTKQTLVVERDVILSIGGWDESFRSRVHSELFLRLNPACSLIGIPQVAYRLRSHAGPRVSDNMTLRQESFERLIDKHRTAFESHPRQFALFTYQHARTLKRQSQNKAALQAVALALRIHPPAITRNLFQDVPKLFPSFD
ncbi:glycosyltransferase [Oscillatoria sp. CS-180]|uniref:glycosyltransferase family 2 protein n=1 Tax=Oscillatoria sp. CS-180 TaxID=3021720 RepID=UPI00233047F2|nr:glycosyltransferase [Oscillatoria sp. CS-180]MDB9527132.1 glycosyltransferase [Oscillatoria sp. CS-180]